MSDRLFVGMDVIDVADNGLRQGVTSVTLQVDNEHTVTAGAYTGLDLYALCPYATQEMAAALLVQVQGYQYQAFSASGAGLDPAAELGDGVTVGGIYGVISSIADKGDGYPDIAAPGEQELEDEYPYRTATSRELSGDMDSLRASVTQALGAMQIELNSVKAALESMTLTLNAISQTVTQLDSRVTALEERI